MSRLCELQWDGDVLKMIGKGAMETSGYELGLMVEAEAKEMCAVDQGYLAASITTQGFSNGTKLDTPRPRDGRKVGPPPEGFRLIDKSPNREEVLVGTAVYYAAYVEFGTAKMNSQPFLRPAMDLASGRVLSVVGPIWDRHFANYRRRPKKVGT